MAFNKLFYSVFAGS